MKRSTSILIGFLGILLCATTIFSQTRRAGEGKEAALGDKEETRRPLLGGPCEYKSYPGTANIVSVSERRDPFIPDLAGEYEASFVFEPDQEIQEPLGQVQGREFLLLTENFQYPDAAFLKEHGIEPGKTFPCFIQIIVKGTCTPILFHFPTIHR